MPYRIKRLKTTFWSKNTTCAKTYLREGKGRKARAFGRRGDLVRDLPIFGF